MIINASPLIIFGKLDKIGILIKLFKNIEISYEVYNEVVVKGSQLRDALIVKEHVEKGSIKVIKLEEKHKYLAKRIQLIFSIDPGEAETIALAIQLRANQVMIDEISAREAAKSLELNPIGTLGALLLAFKRNILNEIEVSKLIEEMLNSKYRVGAEVIIEFWNRLNDLKKAK